MVEKIGFIGTGVMGTSMIKNLLKANYPVTVYNRTQAHAQAAIDAGATWAYTPAAVTRVSDVIITMVGFPQDVEEVYFGKHGIFSVVKSGQTLIDMTTSKPSLAKKIFATAVRKGINSLDAPVSGGDIGAQKGELTIMVGGSQGVFAKMLPIFHAMGKDVNIFGGAGSGQSTKMANQIMIAGTMTGLTEMLVYAKKANLDVEKVLKTVGGGSAANWSLSNYGPRILAGDYTPGFFAKHFLKDLRIALDEAKAMDLDLPATQRAEELYQQLVEVKKLGDDGTQALVKLWWPETKDEEDK
ncbi:MAG TPA: NAD(P)-dependent oxidoreductase [Lapidilactobacillus dextrinicus]|uniref:NAD(P)-dependent oxidoreductase n=1 Tax=Lapidilactobacillus dextrinicus TaxID=51664 RepID=A0A921DUK2_9LACO|nr:NAD(P)-dependent oxidoreductase [Lapidilactobacillus dextrinicus]HJE15196.1 NAD(P)-dependent oxidoreductase [Lapidilactobacillus dextrinicus]